MWAATRAVGATSRKGLRNFWKGDEGPAHDAHRRYGALYALYDRADEHHEAVREFIESYRGPIVVPLPVIAELDYFLVRYLGVPASLDFLDSLESGAFSLDYMTPRDVTRCRSLIERYDDLRLGFVDAALRDPDY